jgi:hypothetical protein
MWAVHYSIRSALCSLLFIGGFASQAATSVKNNAATAPALRWMEGQTGCTFSADDDGKYRYGLWTSDFGITLAVDSQELEKARRRLEPVFAVLLTFRYRGKDALDVDPGKFSLEFVSHFHDAHGAINPDDLAAQLQKDTDALGEEAEREIRKHPEKKDEKQTSLQAREKDLAEMVEFLSTRSLRPAKLVPEKPEVTGWVFFSARSRWVGDWKKQEEFVLRVPLQNRVVEFPFALPPSRGDLILRRRPEN